MRKVIGVGETVLDIVFKHEQPIGALPGGSVFNTIVSLGRVGADATFISAVGNDRVGTNVISFLKDNGVQADYVTKCDEGQTPISLAFLNERNDADDIVVFGSYYAVSPATRPQVVSFLEYAHNRGAIIYYDVNFRSGHRTDVMRITPNLLENYEYADVVRGSREDFEVLYRLSDPAKVYAAEVSFYCKRFVYTDGANPVQLRADGGFCESYAVGNTQPVSTIGAGDNFNAGFIFGMLKLGVTRQRLIDGLTKEQWNKIMSYALAFSAESCKGTDNYVPKGWKPE